MLIDDAIGVRLGEMEVLIDPKFAVASAVEANGSLIQQVERNCMSS